MVHFSISVFFILNIKDQWRILVWFIFCKQTACVDYERVNGLESGGCKKSTLPHKDFQQTCCQASCELAKVGHSDKIRNDSTFNYKKSHYG